MTPEPLNEKPEIRRGIEKTEVPDCRLGRPEGYWRGVLDRVKERIEARHSKEGGAP